MTVTIVSTCKTSISEEGGKTEEASLTISGKQDETQSDTSDHSADECKEMEAKTTQNSEHNVKQFQRHPTKRFSNK